MKNSTPLALLVAVGKLVERVNAEFTMMLKSFICSQLGAVSFLSSAERAVQKTREPSIDFNRFNRWNESIANEESMLASHLNHISSSHIRNQVRGGGKSILPIN